MPEVRLIDDMRHEIAVRRNRELVRLAKAHRRLTNRLTHTSDPTVRSQLVDRLDKLSRLEKSLLAKID